MQCEMYTIKILFGSQQVTNVKMFKKKKFCTYHFKLKTQEKEALNNFNNFVIIFYG